MTNVDLISLNKSYFGEKKAVLRQFNLNVSSGELVVLLGPSGSGKSTLLKLIAGLGYPDSGDIQFDGKSILSTPSNKRGAVLMFQKAYLFPFLTVEENIGFGLKVRREKSLHIKSEVARMLELIGLPGIQKKRPEQLSGGEQHRVALARALIVQPKLMLLDEPLSSLDTAVRVNLQEAIRRIQREFGITTILVTHDLTEAMSMSDRMALLLDGHVAAVDHPMQLFQHPPTQSSARFVGVSTFLKGSLAQGQLSTLDGKLEVNSENTVENEAIFAIRPENIRIVQNAGLNTLPGVVSNCIYRGEYIEYQVELRNQQIRARVPMPAEMIAHGHQVEVLFPSQHLFQVSEE